MLFNNKAKGFTLTEVLLALAIVGIIAALVLPSTIAHFNEEVLDAGFTREQQAIKTAVEVLPIKENKSNFGETSMYSDGTKTPDESSGKFMKRYLRLSKYYGDAVANKDLIKQECFASKYYEYSEGQKKEFSIDDWLHGACARLKNGASLCLSRQISTTNDIQGVMDLNGPKGPNVKDKDLRFIRLNKVAFSTRYSEVTSNNVSTEVKTESNPGLEGDGGYENLCQNDYSTECCNYFNAQGQITSRDHGCCSNPAIASSIAVCSSNITLRLNLYPSSCNNNSESCKVYVQSQNTTAKLNNSGSALTLLPAIPPDVMLFCDGKKVGSMSGTTLAQALVQSTSGIYYFSKDV